jgi:Arrestin (or S-antigen), C-terminal domain/Arrestin (or S-antigen), N-terminal domain
VCLFGAESDTTDIEFLPNEYEYKFQYKLPVNLPHSLRDFYGTISYEVRCIISSNSEAFKEGIKFFTVVRDDDLSLYPELRDPVEAKDSSSALCSSENLQMKVSLPYSVFSVGGKIPITIKFIGPGSINIQYIRFVLKRIMIFNSANSQSKVKLDNICKSYIKEYAGHNTLEVNYDSEIPKPLILSNNRFTKLIQVKYSLEVKAKNSGCFAQPAKVSLPIIIGTRSFTSDGPDVSLKQTGEQDLREYWVNFIHKILIKIFLK